MRYCPGYGGMLLRKRGYSLKVTVKRHVRLAPLEEIETFQRSIRRRIKRCQKRGIPVPVQDEAMFVADARRCCRVRRGAPPGVQDEAMFVADANPGRVYTPPGIRAVCHVSGTHGGTIVYGVPSLDGEQIFRQYGKFNGDTFAEYIKEMKNEFGRALMIADRAPQHRADIVGGTLRDITGIHLTFLPAA